MEPGSKLGLRTALVHDWLTGFRGGEQVLLSLARLYPEANLHTLIHVKNSLPPELEARRPRGTFIGKLPFAKTLYRHYLPLFPLAISSMKLDGYDLVISSSHCVAKSARVRKGAIHICYCHTPMRYVWDRFDDYFGPARLGRAGSFAARAMAEGLRAWDVATAGRVHHYIANSRTVEARIQHFYGIGSTVIEPPVDTSFFTPDYRAEGSRSGEEPYDLVVSALVPYKRIDLAILAARARNRRLRIVGRGPEAVRLRRLAGGAPNISFESSLDAAALRDAYRGARALVLPGVEDFGIVVAEALACGTPAVTFARGGGAEIIEKGAFGELFEAMDHGSLVAAFDRLDDRASRKAFSKLALRERAQTFDRARFESRIRDFIAARTCL